MHDKPAAVTQASVHRAAVQGMGGSARPLSPSSMRIATATSMPACVGVPQRPALAF
jgi:hypothetical protein